MQRARRKKLAKQREITAVDKVLGNSDLLTKILKLLPPKPLVRSKAVSNHWFALISDHQFLLNYSRRLHASQPPSSISQFYHDFVQRVTPIYLNGSCDTIPKLDFLEASRQNKSSKASIRKNKSSKASNFQIQDSCNGLFLCQYLRDEPFIVFNPTTKKYRLLPKPLYGYVIGNAMYLTFDPCVSFHYQVVNFRQRTSFNSTNNCWYLSIFSSENWSWKEVTLAIPQHVSGKVFWNGALNWIGYNNSHVRFYVEEEKFTHTQLPVDTSTPILHGSVFFIRVCDSGLRVIIKTREINQNGAFSILEMSKDSNCWATKYRFDLRHLISEFPEIGSVGIIGCRVFYVKSEADKRSFSLVLGISEKIILHSVSVDQEGNNNFLATTRIIKNLIRLNGSACHPFIQCLAPI